MKLDNLADKKLVLAVARKLAGDLSEAFELMGKRMTREVEPLGPSWNVVVKLVAQNVVNFSDESREIFRRVFHKELVDSLASDILAAVADNADEVKRIQEYEQVDVTKAATYGKSCAWCGVELSDVVQKLLIFVPDSDDICCNSRCYHSYLGDQSRCTTDGKPPIDPNAVSAPGPIREDGQHEQYWVLCDAERKKGFVRPYRDSYVHVGIDGHEIDPTNPARSGLKGNGCGVETKMGRALSETYARDPGFYGSTFCVGCGKHFPVAEFKWNDGEVVGS